jgi:hypothetical protein
VPKVLMLSWLIPPLGLFIASLFHFLLSYVYISPRGGEIDYLALSPASRRGQRKGNPVSGCISGPHFH